VSQIAARKVKVALTGQGVDEPWAGYHRYKGVKLSQFYSLLPTFMTDGIVRPIVESISSNERLRRGVAALSEKDILARMVKIYSFFNADMKTQLFQPWVLAAVSVDGAEAQRAVRGLLGDVAGLVPLSQMLYVDTRAHLPDDLLMVGDKTAMANSLEARVPYLDVRIIEFIETLPPHLKLKGFQGKYLHKKAVEAWVPHDVVHRKKKGFDNPIDQWLRSRMKSFVAECLLGDGSAVGRYFDRYYVSSPIAQHESGARNHLRHIYLLISFELWHRRFIDA
jgi:asparagine synthase (glutamine-hydrolysing)